MQIVLLLVHIQVNIYYCFNSSDVGKTYNMLISLNIITTSNFISIVDQIVAIYLMPILHTENVYKKITHFALHCKNKKKISKWKVYPHWKSSITKCFFLYTKCLGLQGPLRYWKVYNLFVLPARKDTILDTKLSGRAVINCIKLYYLLM